MQMTDVHEMDPQFPAQKAIIKPYIDKEIYEELVDKLYEFADELMIFLAAKGIDKRLLGDYLTPALKEFDTVVGESLDYFDSYKQ